jgi:hypothetical protein
VAVADRIERRNDIGRKPSGFLQHRVDDILGEVAEQTLCKRRPEPHSMLERECNVGDRRPVGHG